MKPVCIARISAAASAHKLPDLMHPGPEGQRGCWMAFGPGLTVGTMNFHVS